MKVQGMQQFICCLAIPVEKKRASFIGYSTAFRVHAPMIAVGFDDPNPSAGGKVQIFEHSDNTRYVCACQRTPWAQDVLSESSNTVADFIAYFSLVYLLKHLQSR